MKNITMRYVYDRKGRASMENPQDVLIEVREKGTSRITYINTGVKLYPNQVSKKNGFTCINHDKANMINIKIRRVFGEVESFALSNACLSLSDVKHYKSEKVYNKLVEEFMRSELINKNPSIAVYNHHTSLINRIVEFGGIVYFSDVTYQNIEAFDRFLRGYITSQQVMYKRHKVFSSYISKAVKLGLCESNPYDVFKVTTGRAIKEPVFLTDSEIDVIRAYQPKSERMERVKDLFLFQCMTGLAFIDLMAFNMSWITEENGYKVLSYQRRKTKTKFVTLLLPEAERILTKYDGVLPRLSNQKYNDNLKIMTDICQLTKSLTSHVARHTFATYLLNRDVPIETVSRAIGHTNIQQTQHYAKLLNKKVISDMSKLL